MVNVVRNEAYRAIGKSEVNSSRMRAAKAAHVPPASTGRNASGISLPIEIDTDPSDRPITFAGPGGTISINGRGFADQKCMGCAVRYLLNSDAALMIRKSPEDPKT